MTRLRSWVSRLYSRDGFRGPVVTLLSGTAVTLVLSYLAVPILTRLFTPEQFGISDYFVMMVSVLATVASLRYEDAMMLPEDESRTDALYWLVLVLAVVTTAVVAIATIWSREIADLLSVGAVAPWLWLLAPTLLLMRFSKLTEIWLSRQKSFRAITAGDVTNKATMLSSRIGAGATTNLGAGGLIGGFLLGQVAATLYYATFLWRIPRSPLRKPASMSMMWSVATRYRHFALFSMPSSLLNTVVARLPVLLLPVFFSLEVVGLFGRAFVALAVPLSLVGTAVSHVFFVHAAEAHRDGRLAPMTERIHARLVMIGVFPTLLLIVAGPDLFEFVFGSAWRTAGVYERYLACWFFLSATVSPLTRLFDILERQRTELLISIGTSVALTLAIVTGGLTGSVLLTIGAVAAVGSGVRLLQLVILLHYAGVTFRQAVKPYATYALISLPLVLPVWIVHSVWPTWATALAGAVSGLAYLTVVIYRERLFIFEA